MVIYMTLKNKIIFNDKTRKYIQFSVAIVFYLFFAFFDGAVLSPDSVEYIEMSSTREPIYPFFLWMLRTIFQHTPIDYLLVTVILQNMLSAFASWILCIILTKEFKLSPLFSWCFLFIPMGISIIYRQVSKSNHMFSNSILTEGISVSLFLVFFAILFEYIVSNQKKYLYLSAVISIISISTRKQMLITLALLVIAIFVSNILAKQKKDKLKQILSSVLTCVILSAAIILTSSGIDFGYNIIFNNSSTQHTGSARFIGAISIYTADRKDVQYIKDAELKELYLDIYDHCEKSGYLLDPNLSGWHERATHFEKNCDNIQLRSLFNKTLTFAKAKYKNDPIKANTYADDIMNEFTVSLIPHHIPEILTLFFSNCISGFIYTVSKPKSILILFGILIYLLYILMLIWVYINRKHSDTYKKITIFSTFTLISTVINVAVVALGVFPQIRYMIYNMYLMYASLALMGIHILISIYNFFKKPSLKAEQNN